MKAGWEIKKLGEVCQFINGRAYKKAELLDNGKYPVLRVGNFFTQDKWYFSDLELPENKYCDNGDLLYAWSASFGPRIWQGEKVIYHYHIWKIIENANLITKEFLYFLLDWDTDNLKEKYGTGTTMTHVGKGSIESREVPIPPLPEQRRIVAILDEAFADIAAAKEKAEQNLKNAKEVFEAYSQSIFVNISDNSEERKLGDNNFIEIIDGDRGKNYPKKEDFLAEGHCLFLSTKNVKYDGFLFEEKMFISEDKHKKMRNGKLERNDVVMTTRGTIGNIGLYSDDIIYDFIRINSGMLIFRPNVKRISPEYLFKALGSKIIQDQITKNTSGAAQPQLPIKTLVKFTLPVPKSLSEQRQIVSQLDEISAETSVLESIYQQKLSNLEELKKSLLQQAFSGAL